MLAAGIRQATISAAERTAGIDVLLGPCRALAVTLDQLFRRAGLLEYVENDPLKAMRKIE